MAVKRRKVVPMDSEPGAYRGKSLLEQMWEELDSVMERLMAGEGVEAEDDVGVARGVAWCIALVENPYRVDIERIRAKAMARWEERHEDAE